MNTLAMPSGLRFLESLVTLIRNEDEIEKILGAVRKSYDAANEKILAWGKIEDIDRLRDQATSERSKAKVTLADAEREAGRILKGAVAQATTEGEKKRRVDDLIRSYEKKLTALDSREAEIEKREQEVRDDLAQARTLKDNFDALFR